MLSEEVHTGTLPNKFLASTVFYCLKVLYKFYLKNKGDPRRQVLLFSSLLFLPLKSQNGSSFIH